jgi:hypothetical protein
MSDLFSDTVLVIFRRNKGILLLRFIDNRVEVRIEALLVPVQIAARNEVVV